MQNETPHSSQLRYCWNCDTEFLPSVGCECKELARRQSVKHLNRVIREEFTADQGLKLPAVGAKRRFGTL